MALDRENIYYGIDGERHGPVDLEAIRDLVREGHLLPTDYLWDEDEDDWIPVGRYDFLFDHPPAETVDEEEADFEQEPETLEALPPDHPSVYREAAPLPTAGFGVRLIAFIIDTLILVPFNLLWEINLEQRMGLDLGKILFEPPSSDPEVAMQHLKFLLVAQAGILFIRWLYWAGFESSKWQATPGKKLMRLVATDERGYRLGFGQASARFFGKLLSEFTLLFGYFMIAFTDRHQGLHDKVARTLVLHR